MMNDLVDETIAALATAPGEGGVAIVRISGKGAIASADRIFSGPVSTYATHTAHYGWVQDAEGMRVDDGLCLVLLGERSYTGEDTVEIQCHGGSLVSRRVLEVVLATGVRAARPGEFTYRAYMNGRIDLAQAEAVQSLIGAKNELALTAAQDQLEGALSKKVLTFQRVLTDLTAILEAWVDFPEEGLEFTSESELCANLENLDASINRLVSTFHDGRMIQEGVALALMGAPNVGKSSLMNALLQRERAIVTHVEGTTRDLLEDDLRLGDLHIRLIDTAGIRETSELVEQEGIRRSHEAMDKADLVLVVLDASRTVLSHEEKSLLSNLDAERSIVVWNKYDLSQAEKKEWAHPHQVTLSAKEGAGLDTLKEEISRVIWGKGPPSKEEILVTSLRHKEALVEASDSVQRLIRGLQEHISPEFLVIDARSALDALGSIIGQDITEEILSSIFSRFCIGK